MVFLNRQLAVWTWKYEPALIVPNFKNYLFKTVLGNNL
jgi:hypothetical protein